MRDIKQVHIIIEGRVQGVGFRYFVEKTALIYGILGWVRNVADGSVEIIAQADKPSLDEFVKKCRVGPTSAKVENFYMEELAPIEFSSFSIRH